MSCCSGDAAATAHFSVGSGSKLALESAIALADYVDSEPTLAGAFAPLRGRAPAGSAAPAESRRAIRIEWFEDVERYLHLDPVQFNYSLLTRSQRISHENLRARDRDWLAAAEMWFEQKATGNVPKAAQSRRCSCRCRLRGVGA